MAMPCPRGIQSVTQSRVNVYTRGDNWSCAPLNSCTYSTKSALNMSDTVPSHSTLLPQEWRAALYKTVELRREANGINESFTGMLADGTQIQK